MTDNHSRSGNSDTSHTLASRTGCYTTEHADRLNTGKYRPLEMQRDPTQPFTAVGARTSG